MREETEFKTKEQLEEWLMEDRKVHPRMATTAANTLFPDFLFPSTLLDQSSDRLIQVGLSVPVAQHLSIKLERQQQISLSEDDFRKLRRMVDDHEKKEAAIALSDAKTNSRDEVLGGLQLGIDGVKWNSLPPDPEEMPLYQWIKHGDKFLDEDHPSNRTAYMKHLEDNITLPVDYTFYDAQPNRTLLNTQVDLHGEPQIITGTTDVVITECRQVENDAVRNHVDAQLELKKINNTGNHEPQVCLELIAASILNPSTPILAVLTDLNLRWVFYWYGKTEMGVFVKKLDLTNKLNNAALAKYLLEHFKEYRETSSCNDVLPETFLERLSWNEVYASLGSRDSETKKRKRESHDDSTGSFDGKTRPKDGDGKGPGRSPEEPGGGDRNESPPKKGQMPSGSQLANSLRLLHPGDDVGNELDLLDMLDDEEDRVQMVRSFLARHVVPQITGEGLPNA